MVDTSVAEVPSFLSCQADLLRRNRGDRAWTRSLLLLVLGRAQARNVLLEEVVWKEVRGSIISEAITGNYGT